MTINRSGKADIAMQRSNTGNDPKRAKASGGMTREERLTRMKREMRKYFDEHVLTDGGESTSVEEAAQKNEEVFAKGAEVDKVVNSKEFEKEIADMRLRALYIADEEYSVTIAIRSMLSAYN